MKLTMIALVAAVGVAAAGVAQAEDGAALAEKSGCMKCHAIDAKKKGPALKASAAEYKGKTVDQVVAAMKESKGHKKLDVPDADLKSLAKWVQGL